MYKFVSKVISDKLIVGYLIIRNIDRNIIYVTRDEALNLARTSSTNGIVIGNSYIKVNVRDGMSTITLSQLEEKYKILTDNRYKSKSRGFSKGNQTKWFSENTWYKMDSLGYEGLAEEVAYKFSLIIKNIDVVGYSSCEFNRNGKIYKGCKSSNFITNGYDTITLSSILKAQGIDSVKKISTNTVDVISTVLGILKNQYNFDAAHYFKIMFLFDAIILNEDRHTNNILFEIDSEKSIITRGIIFDNGLSLLSDLEDYSLFGGVTGLIRKVKCKPFSVSFDNQIKAIDKFDNSKLIISKNGYEKFIKEYTNNIYEEQEVRRALYVIRKQIINWGDYIEWVD